MYPGGHDGSATLISRVHTPVRRTVMRLLDECGLVVTFDGDRYGSWREKQKNGCDYPAKGILKESGAGGGRLK